MEIPDDFYVAIYAPDGRVVEEISLDGYDTSAQHNANSLGDSVMDAVARFLERADQ